MSNTSNFEVFNRILKSFEKGWVGNFKLLFLQVAMGGGRRFFLPNIVVDPETNKTDNSNGRRDGRNLVEVISIFATFIARS